MTTTNVALEDFFAHPRYRDWLVVPLWPGTKTARGKWRNVTMKLGELMERADEFRPFDIGVRLDLNDLVLVDADVIYAWEARPDGIQVLRTIDGPENLRAFCKEHGGLPVTWAFESQGRPDGSHGRGEHYLFRQNPAARICGDFEIAPGVEIKTSGIMRIELDNG